FLNGDPDQPIIMGRTYHEDNRSPGSLPGTKTQMTIRSKTYKGSGFNELRFEDATDKEQVYIHAQKNMDTEVLNDRTTDVKHDHTETIGNDQKITVGLGQTVNVGSKKEGGHDQKVTVANDQHLTIKNDRHKVVNNNQTSKVTGTDTEEVVKKQSIKIGDNYELKVEHGTKIISGDSIELICGQGESGTCSIKLEKTGKIIIRGTEFLFEATGPVDIKGKDIHLNG
ncbi:bacteriophage T4 gp5 trimerisation domain-containing protein, partial [Escherichia coli]